MLNLVMTTSTSSLNTPQRIAGHVDLDRQEDYDGGHTDSPEEDPEADV